MLAPLTVRRNTRAASRWALKSLEKDYPFMRVKEYALRRGSAGAGKLRGGLGVRRVYRILADDVSFNCYSDRFRFAPWGLFGGEKGSHSRFLVERGGETLKLDSKVNFPLRKSDRLIIETAGLGVRRPAPACPALVAKELKDGLITAEQAAAVYGVTDGADIAVRHTPALSSMSMPSIATIELAPFSRSS